ncbi:11077_t:CDS:2 [Entrophospora sp. SA101]|nr:11077_t:CDS:2 [Entrophospora sp. SA101]
MPQDEKNSHGHLDRKTSGSSNTRKITRFLGITDNSIDEANMLDKSSKAIKILGLNDSELNKKSISLDKVVSEFRGNSRSNSLNSVSNGVGGSVIVASIQWIEKKEEIKVSFIEPFTVSYSIVPQIEEIKHEKDATNSENSPVVIKRIDRHLLTAKITSNGPWDLLVTGIDLVLLGQANSQAKIEIIESKNNELEDQIWKTGHKHQVNYLLELTILDYISNDYNIDVGLLDIQWKRKELIKNIFIPYTETTMMTPQIIIPKTDLTAILTIPKKSIVGKIFTLTLKLINWTNTQIKIDVMVEVNDTFVFSGYKQTYFNVSPLGSYLFKVNCFPLVPEIHIMAPGYKEISEDEWFFIFIKPKTKI